MNRHQFEQMIDTGICLVDFNAGWCAPCKTQQPILGRLAKRYRGKASILALDVDENRELALSFGITSVPTLSIFKNGREVERLVGLQSLETLADAGEQVLK